MAGQPYLLEARGLKKHFDDAEVLKGVDLAVPAGSVTCVVGKSGTGKSVFLKCLGGILKPDAGEILFDGNQMRADDRDTQVEFRKRCSYLFQSNALLDSLTVLENVALPLEQTSRLSRREFTQRAMGVLAQLELDTSRDKYPSELSGGMQKRVALARALVSRPQLVLFDEPTAGLDPLRRNSVFSMIARYQRALGFTAVVVTHDMDEALVVADRIAFLEAGSIHFQGTPDQFVGCDDDSVKSFRDSVQNLRDEIASVRNSKDQPNPAFT